MLACRNRVAAQMASSRITRMVPNANLDIRDLDLSSLQSVVDFVQKLRE